LKNNYFHLEFIDLLFTTPNSTLIFIIFFSLVSFSSSSINPGDISSFITASEAANDDNNFNNNPEDSIINCPLLLPCVGTFNKDIIIGTSASDRIFGEEGNDLIQGGLLTDEIHGNEGDDTIQGGEGSDILFGEDGNDYLFADSPNSAISLLLNSQNLEFEDSIGNEFQLQDPVIQAIEEEGLLSIIDKEVLPAILLGLGNNSIVIPSFTNNNNNNNNNEQQNLNETNENSEDAVQLSGGSGDDHLFGGSGDDILNGGSGKDFFDCNEGIDTVLDYNSNEDTVNINCENI
jgi:Ca2+-binding RTX toxin-like protein